MEKSLFLFVACLVVLCAGYYIDDNPFTLNCDRRNEMVSCVPGCPSERSCAFRDNQFSCLLAVIVNCTSECVCIDGFFRHHGHCVSREECESICPGPNETYSCDLCENVCSTIHKQSKTNCPLIHEVCKEKCNCKDGYARNNNGVCVPFDECENICPGPNETFSCDVCDNVCSTIHKHSRMNCPIVFEACKERCYCKDGYARNNDGVCVPLDECEGFKPRHTLDALNTFNENITSAN